MKKTFYIVIAILAVFVIFLIILSIFVIPQLGAQNALIANIVIWSICILVILVISCTLRSFLQPRFFELTNEYILFKVPYRPEYKILWAQINKISIKEDTILVGKVRRKFINLIFEGEGEPQEFKLEPGRDYRSKTSEKIFQMIKEMAISKNKQFGKEE